MSAHPRPRHARRRKALRIEHAAVHDHDHAHLRGIVVVAVLVAIAFGALWRPGSPSPMSAPDLDAPQVTSAASPVAGAGEQEPSETRELLPLVTVAPDYPPAAEAAGIAGRCVVEFTVTAAGTTRDVRPVDCMPTGVFEAAAVSAARQFKYRPREQDGRAVDVAGVRNEFLFSLER